MKKRILKRNDVLIAGIIIASMLVLTLMWNWTAYRNVDEIKAKGKQHIENMGFVYDGYQGFRGDPFNGGKVWFLCHNENSPELILNVAIIEWRGELQSFEPTVVTKNYIVK